MQRSSVHVRAVSGFEAEADEVVRSLRSVGTQDPRADQLTLLRDESGWSLTDGTPAAPVRADFIGGEMGRRIRDVPRGEGRLARALGLKHDPTPLVLDATAGLGRETILAAALGCNVVACERSPIVALLLRDGLERAAAAGLAEITARITLREGDARDVLKTLDLPPDVVLVDPMFPERGKTAKAGREMQLLQQLLGTDDDAESLLEIALSGAQKRVVVKRPVHAPPVGGQRPNHSVAGRAARYDIYVTGQPAEQGR